MTFTDEDVLRYCDGTLCEEQSLRLLEACDHDEGLVGRVQAMEASKLPYRASFAQQSLPPVPLSLQIEVKNWIKVSESQGMPDTSKARTIDTRSGWFGFNTRQLSGIAASVALCFVVGYGIGQQQSYHKMAIASQQNNEVQSQWVERVAEYQSLYVEETVTGIGDGSAAAMSLLAGLEATTGLRTAIPDLIAHGYTFVRAQQLGYKGDPLVQLIYTKPGTAPLAVCYMPSDEISTQPVAIDEHEGMKTAGWIQNGQRYVIVGDETTEVMKVLYADTSKVWL